MVAKASSDEAEVLTSYPRMGSTESGLETLVVKGGLGSIEGKDATDQNLRSVWEDGRLFRRILEILKVQLDSNVALKEKEIGQPVYLG